jgi:hypothetical protein
MEVHYLIDHSVARTTLQPPEANCQVCSRGIGRQSRLTHISLYDFWQGPYSTIKSPFGPLQGLGPVVVKICFALHKSNLSVDVSRSELEIPEHCKCE